MDDQLDDTYLVPLQCKPDYPEVFVNYEQGRIVLHINPEYVFGPKYVEEIERVEKQYLSTIISTRSFLAIQEIVYDIMLRAWHRRELLVKWTYQNRDDQ